MNAVTTDRLWDETAAVRSIAEELRRALEPALSPDVRAYAALRADGDMHPWSTEAELIWREAPGRDDWREHHVAVLLHARAYDLEHEGRDDAFEYWRDALHRWGALHADDRFWEQLAGSELDESAVAAVRRRLPRDLLSVHIALVETYRGDRRKRARAHMDLIKGSPFDSALIEELRSAFASPAVKAAYESVETETFEGAMGELQESLYIDPGNEELVRALLYVVRNWNQRLFHYDEDLERVRANAAAALAAVGHLAGPARGKRELRREAARVLYSDGLAAAVMGSNLLDIEAGIAVIDRARDSAKEGAEHLEKAQKTDPELGDDSYYGDAKKLEAQARNLWGQCELARVVRGHQLSLPTAEEQFRKAIEVDPNFLGAHVNLVQALLMAGPGPDELAEPRRELSRARNLVDEDTPAEARQMLDEMAQHLERMANPMDLSELLADLTGSSGRAPTSDEAEALAQQLKRLLND